MKKTWSLLLMIAILLAGLCACSVQPVDQVGTSSSSAVITPADETLALVTSPLGPLDGAVSSSGFYQLRANPQAGSNIVYTDFATGSTVYLCSRPECLHEDDTCTSWFPFAMGYLFMDAKEEHLFCIGNANRATEDTETIWRMTSAGENREKFYQCAPNETLVDAIASGDEHIYFSTQVVNRETRQVEKYLNQANIYDKTVSPLLTCGGGDWLMGAFDDRLVLLLSDEEDAEMRYATFDIASQTSEPFYSYSYGQSDGGESSFIDGEYLYILQSTSTGTADLKRLHIPTGETLALADGLPFFGPDTTSIRGVFGGYLEVTAFDTRANDPENIPRYHYAVNCETGQVQELSLTYPMGEIESFVVIIAEAGSDFLVGTGMEFVTMMLNGPDHTYYAAEVGVPAYALINKEDYWNNQPVYRAVNMP